MAFRKTTLLLACVPLAILLLLETGVLWRIFNKIWADVNYLGQYKWVALGVVVFMLVRYLIIKLHWPFRKGTGKANLETLETFLHEGTHQVVALFLGRRLHSFYVEQHSGVVYTSGSEHTHLFVALAPYCLPWLTLLLVIARVMIKPEWMWLYDMMIGLSAGFHGVCLYKDTRKDQKDINQFPLQFSYLYIVTFLSLNTLIVLVSIGEDYHIFQTIRYIVETFVDVVVSIFK